MNTIFGNFSVGFSWENVINFGGDFCDFLNYFKVQQKIIFYKVNKYKSFVIVELYKIWEMSGMLGKFPGNLGKMVPIFRILISSYFSSINLFLL